jgi:hypothetical protein
MPDPSHAPAVMESRTGGETAAYLADLFGWTADWPGSSHGHGAPSLPMIWTTPAATPAEEATVDKLIHGHASGHEALTYFQTHGHPHLQGEPAFVASDDGTGVWIFPDHAATGGVTTSPHPAGDGGGASPGAPHPTGGHGSTDSGGSPGAPASGGGGTSDTGPAPAGRSQPGTAAEGPAAGGEPAPGGRGVPSGGSPEHGGAAGGESGPSGSPPPAGGPEAGSGPGAPGHQGPSAPPPAVAHDPHGIPYWTSPTAKDWEKLWGTGSRLDPATDPPYLAPGFIPRPPAAVPSGTPLTPAPDRDYATPEEEWEVAKESAWNWLLDKFLFFNPLLHGPLSSWRYTEPPANASSGRLYELRDSYDTMQRFLNVTEFAFGFVNPLIVESALANGLASRFTTMMSRLAKDSAGMIALGRHTVSEIRVAERVIELSTGAPATSKQVESFLLLKRLFHEERAALSMDGAAFEGFEEHIFEWAGKRGDVNIGMYRGSRAKDAAAANKMLGIDDPGPDFVWHHHPDFGRMVLIPRDIHEQVRHWGGVAIFKRLFGIDYP